MNKGDSGSSLSVLDRMTHESDLARFSLLPGCEPVVDFTVEPVSFNEGMGRTEERRKEEEARKAEEVSQAEKAKKAEEVKRAEEAKKAEEARQAEEARRAEEAKKEEEARRVEEARQKEEARRAEEARKAEEAKKEEEARRAEEARQKEEARRAEEAKKEEEARQAEEASRSHKILLHKNTVTECSQKTEEIPESSYSVQSSSFMTDLPDITQSMIQAIPPQLDADSLSPLEGLPTVSVLPREPPKNPTGGARVRARGARRLPAIAAQGSEGETSRSMLRQSSFVSVLGNTKPSEPVHNAPVSIPTVSSVESSSNHHSTMVSLLSPSNQSSNPLPLSEPSLASMDESRASLFRKNPESQAAGSTQVSLSPSRDHSPIQTKSSVPPTQPVSVPVNEHMEKRRSIRVSVLSTSLAGAPSPASTPVPVPAITPTPTLPAPSNPPPPHISTSNSPITAIVRKRSIPTNTKSRSSFPPENSPSQTKTPARTSNRTRNRMYRKPAISTSDPQLPPPPIIAPPPPPMDRQSLPVEMY